VGEDDALVWGKVEVRKFAQYERRNSHGLGLTKKGKRKVMGKIMNKKERGEGYHLILEEPLGWNL